MPINVSIIPHDLVEQVFEAFIEMRKMKEDIKVLLHLLGLVQKASTKLFSKVDLWMTLPYVLCLPADTVCNIIEFALPTEIEFQFMFPGCLIAVWQEF